MLAPKSIWQRTQRSANRSSSKLLGLPVDKLSFVMHPPQGLQQNSRKIQELGVVAAGENLVQNVYHIKQVSGNGQVWTINWYQLKILQKPRIFEDLQVLNLLEMGYKFPLLIPR